MEAQDGFYNVKTQTPTVPIFAAALVDLVETVKQQRKLFAGDGLTFICHGKQQLAVGFLQPQPQISALGAEFYRIVQ